MDIIQTSIEDVLIINPNVYNDSRGFFLETYHREKYLAEGIRFTFVQDNHSGSKKGTLRGLHYQIKNPQGKLVTAIKGEVYDVAVDIRKTSPTFGEYVHAILTEENKKQLWIPPGFAHGFYVLSEWAEVTYKATDLYSPEWERTILWNDPQLGIKWPIDEETNLFISKKDAAGVPLIEAEIFEE